MCPSPPAEPASGRTPCAGAVVRDAAGRLLLVQRGHDPARGRWTLPGGRVEPGETAAAAAAREVREETGLDVSVGPVLLRVAVGDYDIEDFAADVIGGQLHAADDAVDVGWFTTVEVEAMNASGELTDGLADELRRIGIL